MNMLMPWVDIKINKESMIPTLTLTIPDGGIIQISVMETKHKLLLHHLTIGNRVFNKECNNHIKSDNKCHQPKIQVLPLKILLKPFPLIQFNFNKKTKASIRNLEAQMGQMAATLSQIQARDSGKLLSQTIVNPRENANAITLRIGKQLETR